MRQTYVYTKCAYAYAAQNVNADAYIITHPWLMWHHIYERSLEENEMDWQTFYLCIRQTLIMPIMLIMLQLLWPNLISLHSRAAQHKLLIKTADKIKGKDQILIAIVIRANECHISDGICLLKTLCSCMLYNQSWISEND